MGALRGFEHIIREHEPLAPYTWLRLGGAAEYFAEPTSAEELKELVAQCREHGIPVRVLGDGSNLLVRDQGVPGLVIHLGAAAFSQIAIVDNVVTAGAGAKLGHVISTAVREGLSGLEPLVGIPGTVGGALRSNAGTESHDVGQWTESAEVMTRSGDLLVHGRDDLRFAYHFSSIDELVILRAGAWCDAGYEMYQHKRLARSRRRPGPLHGARGPAPPRNGRHRTRHCPLQWLASRTFPQRVGSLGLHADPRGREGDDH